MIVKPAIPKPEPGRVFTAPERAHIDRCRESGLLSKSDAREFTRILLRLDPRARLAGGCGCSGAQRTAFAVDWWRLIGPWLLQDDAAQNSAKPDDK